ncbi:hypothetical protein GF366_01200 [Candidatus Peregrinibacteria bacterium]|nr:hypothetical protein [Candidatus Peregrinibacteria bacterium]
MDKPRFITFIILLIITVTIGIGAAWIRYSKEIRIPFISDPVQNSIDEAIEAYDFKTSDYSETVDAIKNLGEDAIPGLADMIENEDKKVRYISFISLSGLAYQIPEKKSEIIPLLNKGLQDTDPTIKVQTAQILSLFGEKAAVPVLIDALDSEEMMVPSEPIMLLREYAYFILRENTDQDYGYEKDKWFSWWEENKNTVEFDEENKKFKTV